MKNTKSPTPNTPETDTKRRTLIGKAWMFLLAICCLELGWFTVSLLQARRNRRIQSTKMDAFFDAGTVDQFQPGDVKAFPQGKFYLVCLDDGGFMALSKTCSHLGCSVPWDQGRHRFVCPCHGSTFDQKGLVMTPPAIRPLDFFPLRIENGRIKVDTSTRKKQESFDPLQVMYS